jgi:hypothetical protein
MSSGSAGTTAGRDASLKIAPSAAPNPVVIWGGDDRRISSGGGTAMGLANFMTGAVSFIDKNGLAKPFGANERVGRAALAGKGRGRVTNCRFMA